MEKSRQVNKPRKCVETFRVNILLKGLCAEWAREIKELGLVTSNHDLVNQAVTTLYEKITDERLKIARLRALEKAEKAEENNNV
jgi:hypothetical protein